MDTMENIFHRLHCLHFLCFDESWTESGVFQSPVISISKSLCISCNFCSVKVLVCCLLKRWLESHLLRLIQCQEPEFYLVIDQDRSPCVLFVYICLVYLFRPFVFRLFESVF
ncbi:unnamed protein product [Rangifer tarandus platyrhynchus]|uniref:Uncharacterized protein n=2 Tax=Rangifer tarandus platyrhynchus TaxID=3082113 RepID=A0AC59ZVD8_RANTA|nr:unnamed protein product [Rangifer tarandus platyrhynchus]